MADVSIGTSIAMPDTGERQVTHIVLSMRTPRVLLSTVLGASMVRPFVFLVIGMVQPVVVVTSDSTPFAMFVIAYSK